MEEMATFTHLNTRTVTTPRPQFAILGWLFTLMAVSRSRTKLAELDDALLNDIGVTRAEALKEAQRPIWDLGGLRG